MHRWLQDLADDAAASGNDLIDITSDTPSERSTDNIITLNAPYNIDDDAAEYLFAGSITQAGGDTVYSGLQVLGAVNTALTQIHVVQNNQLYPFTTDVKAPFWGDQTNTITGDFGYNGAIASAVLMRCLIKSRDNGADIDGKRVRVQARHWGDTYDFFNVTLGQGESVAALGTTPDAQNDTAAGTVTTYTHVTNSGGTANDPTGGFQAIDLNNGSGALDYYSQWTYGANTSGDLLKGVWEYIKELSGHGGVMTTGLTQSAHTTFTAGDTGYTAADVITLTDGSTVTVDTAGGGTISAFTIDTTTSTGSLKNGDVLSQVGAASPPGGTGFNVTVLEANLVTQKTIDTLNGNLFLGVTHDIPYTGQTVAFAERAILAWGANFAYDGGTIMNTPVAGDRIVFSGGAGGQIMHTDSGAATGTLYVRIDAGETVPAGPETFICYNDAGTALGNAVINGAVSDATVDTGGTALILADDDNGATGNLYVQLLTGTAPGSGVSLVDDDGTQGDGTSGSAVSKTIPKIYLGSYTGTLIGAYGVGLLAGDLTASDTITPLVGATQTPPNNVTFTVTGLVWDSGVDGESDRVLVGPRAAGILQKNQFAVTGNLTGSFGLTATDTALEINVAIPTDTPTAGDIRIENDVGVYLETPYSSYTANTFTITAYGDTAALTNNVFVSYIDANVAANTTTLSFTSVYLADRDLFVRVRDGGATPIKTFEAPATLAASGGSIAAIRTTDL
jgi:hypothetical protein